MKHEPKPPRRKLRDLGPIIRRRPAVFAVYLVLRLIVIAVLVSSILRREYESAFICLLVLVLFMLPFFIQQNFGIELPSTLEIIILLFIFAAEILGELGCYFITYPYWDSMLHTTTGFLCAATGFALKSMIARYDIIRQAQLYRGDLAAGVAQRASGACITAAAALAAALPGVFLFCGTTALAVFFTAGSYPRVMAFFRRQLGHRLDREATGCGPLTASYRRRSCGPWGLRPSAGPWTRRTGKAGTWTASWTSCCGRPETGISSCSTTAIPPASRRPWRSWTDCSLGGCGSSPWRSCSPSRGCSPPAEPCTAGCGANKTRILSKMTMDAGPWGAYNRARFQKEQTP